MRESVLSPYQCLTSSPSPREVLIKPFYCHFSKPKELEMCVGSKIATSARLLERPVVRCEFKSVCVMNVDLVVGMQDGCMRVTRTYRQRHGNQFSAE